VDCCWVGVTGVVAVGAEVDAILLGGLGSDGKKGSVVPFGSDVPFVVDSPVGDPR
jgi:hypothetical protein